MSASENWTITMTELPGVIEGGMPGKNGQRKPGTTRGSPRRSRTAKASRISRPAVKSRCASEWGGWGRLSDDGADSGDCDQPFRLKVITDSGDRDHAMTRPTGPARGSRRSAPSTRVKVA